jgi:hypothetical protein
MDAGAEGHMLVWPFAKMAPTFRRHIEASIPGYKSLLKDCVRHSLRFVQPNTNVYDVGCTDGHLLARVRRAINIVANCRKNQVVVLSAASLESGAFCSCTLTVEPAGCVQRPAS